ncbi:uracil-DNA glycosylase [Candidatus Dojkabacteria bacterium]|uniref:Type-4 uracil-DNA glycosylase n=1 Tax=Candidatus Dojkabacteria bacterium TaxID=2099670 RepID=A0A955L3N2_9BACT|nr:uracil-DNA glycosylase [Candidatus Dojkabacteria bacterium]
MKVIDNSQALNELHTECKQCRACKLRGTATQVVPGSGNPNADILFIGEAPGKNEDIKGIPFCGAAGKLLDELLESIKLNREDIFITNTVKCRPPGNRDPEQEEIEACKHWLKSQVEIIKPKIIVTLGRYSMARYLPFAQISKDHGKAYKKGDLIFFVLYHPAVGLYKGSMKEVLFQDMQKLDKILKGDYKEVNHASEV